MFRMTHIFFFFFFYFSCTVLATQGPLILMEIKALNPCMMPQKIMHKHVVPGKQNSEFTGN